MTTENERISKSYYQTMINESNKQGNAVKILGDMYIEEMQKHQPNLSSIRFAQGEVYYLNQDYEAAIFKWQQPLEEELIPWAQKNIADAQMELGLLEDAEGLYRQVNTSSLALQSEVLLQLLSLYVQQGNQIKAVSTIKEAVTLNPDYPRLTEIAQAYLEDINDWNNAIELAVDEAIRTQSIYWVEVLSGYAQKGLNVNHRPDYFNGLLIDLLHMDRDRFESFTEVLWNSYRSSAHYLEWLSVINRLLFDLQNELPFVWEKLPNLYQEAYFDLISGEFLIQDISDLIQIHLANWLEITSESDALVSSTAILAWDETIPSVLNSNLISKATYLYENAAPNRNGRKDGVQLFDAIQAWAKEEDLLEDLTECIGSMLTDSNMETASPSKIQRVIKASITFLLEQRIELEKGIQEDIHWNETLLTNLQHTHQQIGTMEKEAAYVMTDTFRKMKNSLTQRVLTELPKQLQDSSSIIQEDSDFSTIHEDLNEEMNKRIASFMKKFASNDVKHAIQQWIKGCKSDFKEHQVACNELSQTINMPFDEEKVVLKGDFKVLDDWQRDLERISRGLLRIEKTNVLRRNTASQLFLKGAGKLIGSISKNNDMLYSKYINNVENEDYSQTVEGIITPFMQQLDLFENSIEWDVNRFFSNPQDILELEIEKVEVDIESHTNVIQKMHEKPEIYRDPLTLFELRLSQYELMNTIS
ncbi:tetratricopeptide repeat protein [Paraliobacillus sp. JSM ZJ581]|uniref:tetratricopeptide repeat protein n=1 Tax=Paraliobacillus sp. JSM ZJ581 TaxID=3342118 RepID=UPI0035A83F0E